MARAGDWGQCILAGQVAKSGRFDVRQLILADHALPHYSWMCRPARNGRDATDCLASAVDLPFVGAVKSFIYPGENALTLKALKAV